MANDTNAQFFDVFLELFDEAYVGPPNHHSTWFTSNEPHAAILGTLDELDATQASKLHTSGQSIASHAEHLRWSLDLALAYFRGEQPQVDWEDSWKVQTVTEAEWQQLRANLKSNYEAVRAAIAAAPDWSNKFFLTGTIALLPHAAYHLGAIRQMLAAV